MAVGDGYSAGNLSFQIQAMEKNTTATFSKLNATLMTMMNLVGHTSSAFKSLQKTLSSMSRLQFNSLDRLASGLEKLAGINTQGLYKKLNSLARILQPLQELSGGLSGLGQFNNFANGLNKIVKIDVAGFDKQLKSLTESLKPFLEQITVASPSLQAFASAMGSVKGRRTIKFSQFDSGSGSSSGKGLSAFNLTSIVNKIYFLRNYTKQMFRSLTGIVQNAVEYTETLNLWQVAMRGNTQEAEEFIKTMNKGYGIATQTLMQYQAIFKNMLSSLGGLSSDTSYALSEYLTQMAIDYASLYNVSIDRAMTTFQSVLSGQVRPIRSIAGYDITETTIYQLYQQLGGTKTMRQLSQTEKRLLRIYAVFQQMESSGAIGDLNKTLGSTANQWRIFTEATKELGTWLGIIIEDRIAPLLPKLNAIVITLTNITKAIAQMKGIKPQEFGVVESVEQLNEELDKTQGKLLSFDRFEALNSSVGEDNALGIDESLLAGLSKYESILGNITGEAQELAEKWTKLFIDPNTGEWTEFANNIKETTKDIGILLGIVLALKKPLLVVLGGLIALYTTDEDFRLSLNSLLNSSLDLLQNFGDILKDIVPYLVDVFNMILPILVKIMDWFIIANKWMIKYFNLWWDFVKELPDYMIHRFKTIGEIIKRVFVGIGQTIANIFAGVVNGIANAFVELVNFWITQINLLIKPVDWIAGLFGKKAQISKIGWRASWQPFDPLVGQTFKTGGKVEDGIFTMNKGELAGTFDDGSTIVANNQQIISGIKQGVYEANMAFWRQTGMNSGTGDVYLDKTKVGQIIAKPSHDEMVRTGLVKVTR